MRYPLLLIQVTAAAGKTLSLVSGLVLGACNHLSTYISFWTCDKFGRRNLFLAVCTPHTGPLMLQCIHQRLHHSLHDAQLRGMGTADACPGCVGLEPSA